MADKQKELVKQMIEVGQILYQKGLVVGRSGNISSRLDKNTILMSGHGKSLGFLKNEDFAKIDLTGKPIKQKQAAVSTEMPIHTSIYKKFDAKFVIHAHPPLTCAYFAARDLLEAVTFETKLYLGNVPVIYQDTPSVTKLEPVLEALKLSNIVVLKNHGVVAMSEDPMDALFLIEELEAASKMSGFLISIASSKIEDKGKTAEKVKTDERNFEMFSSQHIQEIVDLANQDDYIKQKGQELDLTTQVVIKLDETGKNYKFIFDKGRITKIDNDLQAPFIISGGKDVWRLIFEGKLDPFVATTQGKLKLKGDFGKISKWYAPFNRLFAIFKEVNIV